MTPASEVAPDLMRPITGYRRWDIDPLSGYLRARGREWMPGVNESSDLPGEGNGTGWYAWHRPHEFFIGRRAYGKVYGAILAWGDIMTSHDRFRAQYARIIGLVGKGDMEDVADLYDVPLFGSKAALIKAVKEHDLECPKELRRPKGELVERSEPNLVLRPEVQISYEPYSPTMMPPIPWWVPPAALGLTCYGVARLVEVAT